VTFALRASSSRTRACGAACCLSFVALCEAQSYALDARSLSTAAYNNVQDGYSVIVGKTVQPLDVKAYRKVVLALRNDLDFFMYTFPDSGYCGKNKEDVWAKMRKRVSDLYQTIGAFKDLGESGVPYPDKVYKQLRDQMQKDGQQFQDDNAACDFLELISNVPANLGPYAHDSSDMSDFFWKDVDYVPDVHEPVPEVASILTNEVILMLQDNYPPLLQTHSALYNHPTEEQMMHDYRKTVRTLTYLAATVLPLPKTGCLFTKSIGGTALSYLNATYYAFGSVEDALVAYRQYLADDDKKGEDIAKKAVKQTWDDARNNAQASQWRLQLQCLSALSNTPNFRVK